MSYFNQEQQDYMRYLASIPREQRCACGWARRGECDGLCAGHPEKGGKAKQPPTPPAQER